MPRPKVNKSAAIREILSLNPKTPAKEIIATLAQKGIKISGNLVYLIKAKSNARKRRQRRLQVVANGRAAGIANPVELVLRVKGLAREAGGIRNLKQLVDVLAD